MRALVLTDSGPSFTTAHPEPDREGEAVVAVRLAGVCATDLELVRGYMAFRGVLGHEWVGEVLRAPEGGWVGRRVTGRITVPCRTCPTCLAGRDSHCPHRTTLGIDGRDGAFAERLSLPLSCLEPVPDGVSDEAAVFVEPLAAALQILEQVHVRPTDRVLVLGAGRMGQLCARVLALTGAGVTVLTRSPGKLALLPAAVAGHLLDAASAHAGADLVVDCTGQPAGLELATRLVRPRGTVVLKTTSHGATALPVTPWVIQELTVVGSRCGPFAPALRLLASGQVDPTPLVAATLPLEDGVAALDRAPHLTKVLLRP